jgi:hypothetical protein
VLEPRPRPRRGLRAFGLRLFHVSWPQFTHHRLALVLVSRVSASVYAPSACARAHRPALAFVSRVLASGYALSACTRAVSGALIPSARLLALCSNLVLAPVVDYAPSARTRACFTCFGLGSRTIGLRSRSSACTRACFTCSASVYAPSACTRVCFTCLGLRLRTIGLHSRCFRCVDTECSTARTLLEPRPRPRRGLRTIGSHSRLFHVSWPPVPYHRLALALTHVSLPRVTALGPHSRCFTCRTIGQRSCSFHACRCRVIGWAYAPAPKMLFLTSRSTEWPTLSLWLMRRPQHASNPVLWSESSRSTTGRTDR